MRPRYERTLLCTLLFQEWPNASGFLIQVRPVEQVDHQKVLPLQHHQADRCHRSPHPDFEPLESLFTLQSAVLKNHTVQFFFLKAKPRGSFE